MNPNNFLNAKNLFESYEAYQSYELYESKLSEAHKPRPAGINDFDWISYGFLYCDLESIARKSERQNLLYEMLATGMTRRYVST